MTDAERRIIELLEGANAKLAELVQARRAAAPKPIATDRDLDGPYGNPVVKWMPKDWTGASCKGRRMSECPAELLELLAQAFEYFGEKAERTGELATNGKPIADYKRQDAARARGWAKRVRDGRAPVAPSSNGMAPRWADGQDL